MFSDTYLTLPAHVQEVLPITSFHPSLDGLRKAAHAVFCLSLITAIVGGIVVALMPEESASTPEGQGLKSIIIALAVLDICTGFYLKFTMGMEEKPNLLIVFKVFMGLKNMVLLVSFYMYSENMTLGMTCFFLVMLMANTVYCMLAHMYRRELKDHQSSDQTPLV